MKIIKQFQLKIVIFTAVKYYSILYGCVIVMVGPLFGSQTVVIASWNVSGPFCLRKAGLLVWVLNRCHRIMEYFMSFLSAKGWITCLGPKPLSSHHGIFQVLSVCKRLDYLFGS